MGARQGTRDEAGPPEKAKVFDFDFCLSTSIPVLTTSTCVVAWPQGDQFLGGGIDQPTDRPAVSSPARLFVFILPP